MSRLPRLQILLEQADVVIPVPASRQRLRERGYNPAAQLALHLSKSKCQLNTLLRIQHTAAQSGLDREHRLRNVEYAFHITASKAHTIHNQRVLVIDDVMTTGATLTAASHCLLQAGARQVQVLCLARTP